MPIILQINVSSNWGSHGKIAEMIGLIAMERGWESYMAYGRSHNPSSSHLIKVGTKFDVYEHYVENRLFDNEGLASRRSTQKLVEQVKALQPDIVHLHDIHDHWLNYKILFEYLNQTDIKVVWTFHDFWAMTGHCYHFVGHNCEKWKTLCEQCPSRKGRGYTLFENTKRNYLYKKNLFTTNKNLTIVPVSEWVGQSVKESFFKNNRIEVIANGVDLDVFKPTDISSFPNLEQSRCSLIGKFVIMAVSSQWKSGAKGLDDYKAMSKLLDANEMIVLVGVPDEISKDFPPNIIGIRRTNNQQELAALYTRADVVCSFSSAETFGLTIVEGYACGTPAVVYDNTAHPSLITQETGFVVPDKDYVTAYQAIQKIKAVGKSQYSKVCRKLAFEKYDKNKCFAKYIELYEELIK